MEFQLYVDVVLVHDVPEENLRAGDVGTIVERHQVPGREIGYSIEFFDLLGNTVAVASVPANWLRAPTHSDRLTVRTNLVAA